MEYWYLLMSLSVTRDFFRGTPDRIMRPEVDSDSESKYQGFILGVKAAGAFG